MMLLNKIARFSLRIDSFLVHCFRKSYGLKQLDLKLIDAIKPSADGFYVELGANDGLRQSNTYLLQKRFKWSGVLIEPSPIKYLECVKNRDFIPSPSMFCNACVPFSYKDKFVEIIDSDLMSVATGLDVDDESATHHANNGLRYSSNFGIPFSYGAKAVTLTEILADLPLRTCFDLLSVDVEGNELSVLKGLDFARFKPRWILCEVRRPDEITEFLSSHGYFRKKVLNENDRYLDVLYGLL